MIYINHIFLELYYKFDEIKKLNYVKSIRNGYTGVGATFEYLINKKEDQLPVADYKGVEIKTKMFHTKTDINLFSANPSGKYSKETIRLSENYGYPDETFSTINILNTCAYGNKLTHIKSGYYFKLNIDYINEKIILEVYDKYKNLIDTSTYWDFSKLKVRFENKIKYLALIHALRKKTKNDVFYKYYKIEFYNIKNFSDFIYLIDKGYIRIIFKVGIFKNGPRNGELHDHGTSFQLGESNILLLYNKIDIGCV